MIASLTQFSQYSPAMSFPYSMSARQPLHWAAGSKSMLRQTGQVA